MSLTSKQIERIVLDNKKELKELAKKLTIDEMLNYSISNELSHIYLDQKDGSITIEKPINYHILFTASKTISLDVFKLKEVNLRNVMNYKDFLAFAKKYCENEDDLSDFLEADSYVPFITLYAFDKTLYRKYSIKQAEDFLKDTSLIFKDNELRFVKEKRLMKVMFDKADRNTSSKVVNTSVSLPIEWVEKLGISEDAKSVEMKLTDDSIIIKKVTF